MRHELVLNIGEEGLPATFLWGSALIPTLKALFSAHVEDSEIEVLYVDQHLSKRVTEPTFIATINLDYFDREEIEAAIERLCVVTNQGCIAYRAQPQEGPEDAPEQNGLIGPRAADWGGAFDAKYFEDAEVFQELDPLALPGYLNR